MAKQVAQATHEVAIPAQGGPPANQPPNWGQPVGQVLIPTTPVLQKQTYSAAMSYIGSTRRILAMIRRAGVKGPLQTALAVAFAIFAIPAMWLLVTVWYVFTLVIFGWFMIPFRLIRRGSRKQEHLQRAQLATMQAMMIQQQQAMIQNQQRR